MNWEKIKEDYPKAYELFSKSDQYKTHDIYGFIETRIRDLYDFFDENKIYITLGRNIVSFYWCVTHGGTVQEQFIKDPHGIIKLRSSAEVAAFNKAFEILETKLK